MQILLLLSGNSELSESVLPEKHTFWEILKPVFISDDVFMGFF